MPRIRTKKGPKLDAKLQAFDYQKEAVLSVRDLPYAAIFHEQGLGKTKIAIDVMLHWFSTDIVDTVLLITKKTLVANWQRELSAHSFITPRVLGSSRQQNFYVLNSPARIVLTHFEAVKTELNRLRLFCEARRVAAVLDESARIKNPESAVTKAITALSPDFVRRLILTGTPVSNRPYDIWSQIYFLDNGESLGSSFEEFRRRMDITSDLSADEERRYAFETGLEGVFSKIRSFSVRETKRSSAVHLPDKIYENVACEWEPKQKILYDAIRNETRVAVRRGGVVVVDESDAVLKRLLRLVQVASNPALVDEDYSQRPGKWPVLNALVNKIVLAGEKAIVWTTFTENASWLAEALAEHGAVAVHGRLSIEQRNRSIDRFLKDPSCKVFVATPGAAKEGLTLTVANNVIFFDRSFSLDDYLQAQDRIHRVSQLKTCYIFNLLMEGSVDEWVDVLLHAKRVAAQLAQGDIDIDGYRETMIYSFGDILSGVLGEEDGETYGG